VAATVAASALSVMSFCSATSGEASDVNIQVPPGAYD
jgi:hypothetical protein